MCKGCAGKRAGKRGSSSSHVLEQDTLLGESGVKRAPLLYLEPFWGHHTPGRGAGGTEAVPCPMPRAVLVPPTPHTRRALSWHVPFVSDTSLST